MRRLPVGICGKVTTSIERWSRQVQVGEFRDEVKPRHNIDLVLSLGLCATGYASAVLQTVDIGALA